MGAAETRAEVAHLCAAVGQEAARSALQQATTTPRSLASSSPLAAGRMTSARLAAVTARLLLLRGLPPAASSSPRTVARRGSCAVSAPSGPVATGLHVSSRLLSTSSATSRRSSPGDASPSPACCAQGRQHQTRFCMHKERHKTCWGAETSYTQSEQSDVTGRSGCTVVCMSDCHVWAAPLNMLWHQIDSSGCAGLHSSHCTVARTREAEGEHASAC